MDSCAAPHIALPPPSPAVPPSHRKLPHSAAFIFQQSSNSIYVQLKARSRPQGALARAMAAETELPALLRAEQVLIAAPST